MTNEEEAAAARFWSRARYHDVKKISAWIRKEKQPAPICCSACAVTFPDDEAWLKHEPACTAANRFHF